MSKWVVDLFENITLSKNNIKKTFILWISLMIISLILMLVWTFFLNIKLSWDNLTVIIWFLFISGLSLILFPMYFQNNTNNSIEDLDEYSIKIRIKELLFSKETIINENGYYINDYRLNNKEENIYLIKVERWVTLNRNKRFIIAYNLPTGKFYIIKNNLEQNIKKENIKEYFINFDKETYPDFRINDKENLEWKIDLIVTFLSKIKK